MSPERKSKFSDPAFLPEGEKMFREKFSENLQMVEDIITTFGDENQLEKFSENLQMVEDIITTFGD